MSTTLTLLSGGYLEIACANPWMADPMKRHYVIRRTVDYRSIPWC
jgi:hypothetical protein